MNIRTNSCGNVEEFSAKNVNIHLEALDDHSFCLIVESSLVLRELFFTRTRTRSLRLIIGSKSGRAKVECVAPDGIESNGETRE